MPQMEITETPFAKVCPLLVAKAEKKSRTRDEVDQVTAWLTGYMPQELAGLEQSDTSWWTNWPRANPGRRSCGNSCRLPGDPLEAKSLYTVLVNQTTQHRGICHEEEFDGTCFHLGP